MLFGLATVVMLIILLNLLISFLGHAFDSVIAIKSAIDYRTKCEMMLEVEHLLFCNRKKGTKKYIHFA